MHVDVRTIGIVGGVGPYAGLDLATKIFDQTIAAGDQDHLPVALLSLPSAIGDRTAFLTGQTTTNPGYAIAEVILKLEQIGARVVGIPCNTAHAPPIFGLVREQLEAAGSRVRLLNMIEEVAQFVRLRHPGIERIGVLCTTGTARSGVYPATLAAQGLQAVLPEEAVQEQVQSAIYDPGDGIKACSHPVTPAARVRLLDALAHLGDHGARAVILGCTEIPLAVPEPTIDGVALVDATWVLAHALIREAAPDKLKPLP